MESYEKKYKELEGKIKKAYLYTQTESTKAVLEDILPELKESEDEKIRRNIIAALKGEGYYDCDLTNECIAWLEKQKSVEEIVERCKKSWYNEGKIAGMAEGLTDDEKYQQGWHDAIEKQVEKPQGKSALDAANEEKVDNANMIEPKFHEGDWIVYNYSDTTCPICKIIQVDKEVIDLVSENGCLFQTTLEDLNVNYHLWTIQDAKDGDVLYSLDSKQPFIFKHRKNHEQAEVYCGINIYDKFFVENTKDCIITLDKYVPATKVQRDFLFAKMKEAGYEWDAEKKELKKIESNPAWSEEDEKKIKKIMYIVSLDGRISNEECKNIFDWLEPLKDRVQTQKQWKPSEEQIQCLHDAVEHYHTNGYPASKLTELYEQMSKIYKL